MTAELTLHQYQLVGRIDSLERGQAKLFAHMSQLRKEQERMVALVTILCAGVEEGSDRQRLLALLYEQQELFAEQR